MASLLDRISLPASTGPHRTRLNRAASTSAPYNRNKRPEKGDIDHWQHDMFIFNQPLLNRLTSAPLGAPKVNFHNVKKALYAANGATHENTGLAIKGASTRGNVVRVEGLAEGTSTADAEVFFKQIGPITAVKADSQSSAHPIIYLTYQNETHAKAAVDKFHDQVADGHRLKVTIAGAVNASLPARLGAAMIEGSVDVLMSDQHNTSSKLRSDKIMAIDTRAQVLLAPPGADSEDFERPAREGRARRARGRGRGPRRRGGPTKST